MEDIRLFGNDGDYLILEALDGQKFRLLPDDSLKSALKREVHSNLDSISITPREIQDHIRNGLTMDEIVDLSGAPLGFIEKFAAPVLDELAHMVDSAKSVRITTSHDRYSDSTHVEFGDLVESRLAQGGASAFVWSAKRGDFNSWIISVNFLLANEDSFAAWSFDPRKLTLSPENESAVSLSTNDPLSTTPIPKLRPILVAEQETLPSETAEAEVVEQTAIRIVSAEPEKVESVKTPWIKQITSVEKAEQVASPELEDLHTETPLSATADLLQALRIKRGEREAAAEAAPQQRTAAEPTAAPSITADTSDVDDQPPVTPKKGRAAMPSWDQIVFGTKTED